MILYRVGSSEEKDIILNQKSFSEIGRYFHDHKMNTFHYGDTRYMHFLCNREDLFVFGIRPDTYLFTYDIPDDRILDFKGIGYYYHPIDFSFLNSLDEYAIPSEMIQFDYLEKIEHISREYFSSFSYEELTPFLELVYSKEKPKVLARSNF